MVGYSDDKVINRTVDTAAANPQTSPVLKPSTWFLVGNSSL